MKTRMITIGYVGGALVAAALAAPVGVLADSPHAVSANIGVVSNYIWRGVTQTEDQPAVQGGLDYAHSSGFYAGTWVSNVDWGEDSPNYELDLYLGYGGEITPDSSWDVNANYYAYPDGSDSDMAEIIASGTWKWFTLGLAYTFFGENDGGQFDEGDLYYYGAFEYDELPFDLSFEVHGGYYDFRYDDVVVDTIDVDGMLVDVTETADYWNFGASISKDAGDFGTFSLAWDQNNGQSDAGYDNDPKFWVGWKKEF